MIKFIILDNLKKYNPNKIYQLSKFNLHRNIVLKP